MHRIYPPSWPRRLYPGRFHLNRVLWRESWRNLETRHAQRFLSTRPVKTDRNDARGIAEMMRIGHYRPVHVKSVEAQLIRTTLQARRQIVATLLQVQGTIRGLLRMHGLKVGEIHRNQFDKRVRELLKEMPSLDIAIGPLLRVPEQLVTERNQADAWRMIRRDRPEGGGCYGTARIVAGSLG